jgi:hypothetical protein
MKTFYFHKTAISEMLSMAAFVAELERQGVAYRVEFDAYKFHITITGY